MLRLIVLTLSLCHLPTAWGQQGQGVSVESSSGGISDGFIGSGHFFFFSDRSALGSNELNNGGATFTRFDFQYNMVDYFCGFGAFMESNTFGSDQQDKVTGALFELVAGNLFFKYMMGLAVEQTFSNRSFTTRKGTSTAFELGIRAPLVGGFSFYEFALHKRTVTITSEDGRPMDSKFELSQTMPMLALGVSI